MATLDHNSDYYYHSILTIALYASLDLRIRRQSLFYADEAWNEKWYKKVTKRGKKSWLRLFMSAIGGFTTEMRNDLATLLVSFLINNFRNKQYL